MMNQETTPFNLKRISAEEEIDLRQYWNTISRYRWSIIGLAFVVTLIVALVVFSMQPVYRATATLLIESQQAKVLSIEEIYGLDTGNSEYYQTQFEILKSRELAEKVIGRLDLAHNPEFDPNIKRGFSLNWRSWLPFSPEASAKSEYQQQQELLEQFMARLSISPVRKTQLVNISFESHDAELSATIANTLATVYIESHLEARLDMTRTAATWLTDRMSGLKIKLNEAEQRLQSYRDAENLVDVKGVRTLIAKELDEITSNLVEARKKKDEAENLYNQVRLAENPQAVPVVLDHRSIQTLKVTETRAEQKIAELAKRYGPEHPKMISAQSELRSIQDKLTGQVQTVIESIKKNYEVHKRNESDLNVSMEESLAKVQAINRKEYRLRELERDVEANRKLYDTFFTRFQETDATQDFQAVNARIADPAVAPLKAAKPRKGLSVIIAFIVTLMIGVLLAFLLEHLDNTFTNSADVEDKLNTPLLGLGPKVKLKSNVDLDPVAVFNSEEHMGFAESIRTIRTGLILSGLDNPHQVTVVTSSVPGEGKTTIASCLAIAMGQLENVLLIDADMRRPSIGETFKLPPRLPGLSNLVAQTESLEQCIHSNISANIDILPSGIIPPNPLELLSSSNFNQLLHTLKQKYDRIIIDTAPTQAVSDALILATKADAVIYVVKADETPHHLARNGIGRLKATNAKIAGAILNQLDTSKISKYGNYDYYHDSYYTPIKS
ncbi:MAG: polysaccharide biosynthesis tyrosine autokinase [Gammaproteobacteria bacterium]|nr:polysaccharide biosynthesis tyrosine autokinase [Gammaproteobacteria bacterium]